MSAATEALPLDRAREALQSDHGALRSEIIHFGSSWAALCLAIQTRPPELGYLLKRVGVEALIGPEGERAFNACADGYTVFCDGQARHKL